MVNKTVELPNENPKKRKVVQTRAAVAAYLAGIDLGTIAKNYGYGSPKDAQVAIEILIGETWTPSDLSAVRNKSLARKERLLQSVWYDATHTFLVDKDGKQTDQRNELHLAYLDRAIRIAESIDRLTGANAPTQIEVYRPGSEEFLSTIAELRAAITEGEPQEADLFDEEIVIEDDDEPES